MDASREVKMMQSPGDWPRWPVLPLVKRKSRFIEGIMLAEGGKPTVYVGVNLWGLGDRPGSTYGEKLAGLKTETYESFEELAKEWRVD